MSRITAFDDSLCSGYRQISQAVIFKAAFSLFSGRRFHRSHSRVVVILLLIISRVLPALRGEFPVQDLLNVRKGLRLRCGGPRSDVIVPADGGGDRRSGECWFDAPAAVVVVWLVKGCFELLRCRHV